MAAPTTDDVGPTGGTSLLHVDRSVADGTRKVDHDIRDLEQPRNALGR
jgi:hypothetical protein